jgi:hypothetical protein
MEHKSNKGALILVIILLIIAGFIAYYKELPLKQPVVNTAENTPDNTVSQTSGQWVTSPKFGIKYDASVFSVNEYYKTVTGEIDHDATSGVPVFGAIAKSNPDLVISWGDVFNGAGATCSQSDFGVFTYGVSAGACVKGYRASIGHFSARNSVSQEELNMFGDFVRMNQ